MWPPVWPWRWEKSRFRKLPREAPPGESPRANTPPARRTGEAGVYTWNSEVPLDNYNQGMKFRIVLEYDAGAHAFSVVCPERPGCASAGDTEEEAKQNIKEAIELYLAPSDVELSRDT